MKKAQFKFALYRSANDRVLGLGLTHEGCGNGWFFPDEEAGWDWDAEKAKTEINNWCRHHLNTEHIGKIFRVAIDGADYTTPHTTKSDFEAMVATDWDQPKQLH